jgi:hypothetical protein
MASELDDAELKGKERLLACGKVLLRLETRCNVKVEKTKPKMNDGGRRKKG